MKLYLVLVKDFEQRAPHAEFRSELLNYVNLGREQCGDGGSGGNDVRVCAGRAGIKRACRDALT